MNELFRTNEDRGKQAQMEERKELRSEKPTTSHPLNTGVCKYNPEPLPLDENAPQMN